MRKVLISFLIIFLGLSGCISRQENRISEYFEFTPEDIKNFENIELPLDSNLEAIKYSLNIQEVRDALLDTNSRAYKKYGANWEARATLLSPIGGGGNKSFLEEIRDKTREEGYIVDWQKGKECDIYSIQLKFSKDGTFLFQLNTVGISLGTCK